jgi:hypothetical protein
VKADKLGARMVETERRIRIKLERKVTKVSFYFEALESKGAGVG